MSACWAGGRIVRFGSKRLAEPGWFIAVSSIPLERLEFQPLGDSVLPGIALEPRGLLAGCGPSAIDLRSARFFTVAFRVKTPQAVALA
jgi:hypothetical protein